jgi:hypothetical protein
VAVEVGLLDVGDEELAAVGVGPGVSHGHDRLGVVLERLAEIVREPVMHVKCINDLCSFLGHILI